MAIFAGKILKTIFLRQKEAPSPMTGAILEQSEPSYQPFTGTASPLLNPVFCSIAPETPQSKGR
jgi:hypothetical protein